MRNGLRAVATAAAAVLLVCALLDAALAVPPIIDCGQARRSDEKAVCASAELREMDIALGMLEAEMANLLPRSDLRARDDLRTGRDRFETFRRMCSRDVACLKRGYAHRLKQLRQWKARLLQAR